MAREIKFRAISECKGEHWLYGDIVHYNRNPYTEKWTIRESATGIETDIDHNTIGQCTGMKDDYGKVIYEGDIIKEMCIEEDSLGKTAFGYVKYCEDIAAFCVFRKDKFCGTLASNNLHATLEVVGNIYDNKELLED